MRKAPLKATAGPGATRPAKRRLAPSPKAGEVPRRKARKRRNAKGGGMGNPKCAGGEIGKRCGLRSRCPKACGFESRPTHQSSPWSRSSTGLERATYNCQVRCSIHRGTTKENKRFQNNGKTLIMEAIGSSVGETRERKKRMLIEKTSSSSSSRSASSFGALF